MLTLWLWSHAALAWGPKPHEAIWMAAQEMLAPQAAEAVRELLSPHSGIGISWWADVYRRQPDGGDTARWHYVNIPLDAPGFDRARDCAPGEGDRALPGGACVVAAVEAMAERVGDPELARPVQQQALAFLIHFVGDLHQPLHVADNEDRGGNLLWVRVGRRTLRFHALWDTLVVTAIEEDSAVLAQRVMQRVRQLDAAERAGMEGGQPVDWANETQRVAVALYRGLMRGGGLPPRGGNTQATPVVLPAGYVAAQGDVVMRQLMRASARLAAMLNARFR